MIEGLSGKRVLISGASGFIGGALSSKLVEIGAELTGLSRTPPSVDRFEWITCDVTDEKSVKNAIELVKPDVIYHLASEVTGARSREYRLHYDGCGRRGGGTIRSNGLPGGTRQCQG
jgi:nucleoside-diphosphate-sugar epimerase